MTGTIRIIAGSARGRKVACLPGDGVRPTAARVREAMFSVLAEQIPGARILDLFAGAGTLGLEALSRGAAQVDFVEVNRRHAQVIQENLVTLGFAAQASVTVRDARIWAAQPAATGYDLILLDPPYQLNILPALLPVLFQANIIATSGTVVVEQAKGSLLPESGPWRVGRSYHYGGTTLTLLQHQSPASDHETR